MFKSAFWHRIGAVLGGAMAILPVLGAIPGAGTVLNVVMTVGGVAITLATNLEKVLSGQPKTPSAP